MTTPDSTATDDAELRNAPAEGTGGLIVIVYSPMQSGCHRQLLGRACRAEEARTRFLRARGSRQTWAAERDSRLPRW